MILQVDKGVLVTDCIKHPPIDDDIDHLQDTAWTPKQTERVYSRNNISARFVLGHKFNLAGEIQNHYFAVLPKIRPWPLG